MYCVDVMLTPKAREVAARNFSNLHLLAQSDLENGADVEFADLILFVLRLFVSEVLKVESRDFCWYTLCFK